MRKFGLFAASTLVAACLLASGCGSGGEEGEKSSGPTANIPAPASSLPEISHQAAPEASPTIPRRPELPAENPKVRMTTSMGAMTIELYEDKAPQTVRNFLKYVDGGQYDGTIFHRVYKGQAIQGGAFTVDGREKPAGIPISNEADNGLKNRPYTIAMWREPDFKHSATRQFFINLADNSMLDHRDGSDEGFGYCVFGKVVDGTDVVDRIGNAPTHDTAVFDQTPVETVRIESVQRLR